MLALVLTALLLLLWEGGTLAQEGPPAAADGEALGEATRAVEGLARGFFALLPKLALGLAIIAMAWAIGRLVQAVLRRTLGEWERKEALGALIRVALFLLAIGAALSVLAGDARALVGSVGLVGLALSWSLQTPIESFTGWLLNSLRGYYRVGDRIEVGEVFGDVYRIDVLTTTVWEAGGPGKSVAGAQPTGAMITFPNWELLRTNVINYTRELPYVWDEVTINIANESDLPYTVKVLEGVAQRVVGQAMSEPTEQYQRLLARARILFDIAHEPTVFVAPAEAWTDCTIRYLVPARERRRWASELALAISVELAKPEHRARIATGYPRARVELLGARRSRTDAVTGNGARKRS